MIIPTVFKKADSAPDDPYAKIPNVHVEYFVWNTAFPKTLSNNLEF